MKKLFSTLFLGMFVFAANAQLPEATMLNKMMNILIDKKCADYLKEKVEDSDRAMFRSSLSEKGKPEIFIEDTTQFRPYSFYSIIGKSKTDLAKAKTTLKALMKQKKISYNPKIDNEYMNGMEVYADNGLVIQLLFSEIEEKVQLFVFKGEE